MADGVPERTMQPAGRTWTCIGTFEQMETSSGVMMGPGKVFMLTVAGDGGDDDG
jgi:hypothetical protein